MKYCFFLLILFSLRSLAVSGQDTVRSREKSEIIEGDTVTVVDLNEVVIFPPVRFDTKRQAARYDRLVYNVKKVYPYAKLAAEKLKYYQSVIDTIPSDKRRKQYLKKAEKELEAQFGNQIRDMTFSQGKILIKLIYRETGNSTYDIVKELRGGFTAFVYQTLARLFGYDLRTNYDPGSEDQVIEQIVLMIESGAL